LGGANAPARPPARNVGLLLTWKSTFIFA